ncbi:MAG: M3 family metallopeptidase [Campylobacterales bacterium]|nr:M3 family metallopeptidase [Campylobacterales bacterium]
MSQCPFLEFEVDLEGFVQTLTKQLDANRARIAELLSLEHKTYANFVKPFEMLEERLDQFFTPLSHLNAVENSEATQKVYAEALPLLSDYGTEVGQNLEIMSTIKAIKAHEDDRLNQEQRRVVDLNLLGFRLSGADLDAQSKERLREINLRKSTLTNDFSQNLLDATNAYEKITTDPQDVEGIPPSDLEAAACKIKGQSAWRFTLQMPSYLAYMTYGPNRAIREELYKAYTTRAPQNAAIIDELMALRQESAKLLGFENYAELSLASKMAPSTDDVLDFLSDLAKRSHAQAREELAMLRAMSEHELQSFDTAYYAEKLKQHRYELDEEAYRPYFEQRSVVSGLFEFLHKLFGVRFESVTCKLYSNQASAYDLYVDDTLRARLYMDLEARKNKRGEAWMHNWQSHCTDEEGKEQLASAFIVCNFPPSGPNSPSLLRHDDVVTLFHEMGHALHHLLSSVSENGVSGVAGVEWDAVEFPSQFLENFAYEPKVLRLFAKHYQSGEILSESMIERLERSRNFQAAMSMLRQLEFALFDFKLHLKLHQGEEVQTLLDAIRQDTSLIVPPDYNRFQNGFSHIFSGGYAAGYYSYKWAEVLSADAFFAIVDQGIFNTKLGRDYLEIVLAKGGSHSMQELYEMLMGRAPQNDALLRMCGIAS